MCVCTITGNQPSHNRHVSGDTPTQRTVTTGPMLLPHTCARLPQIHTSHKTTASEPLILASLALQHTGGRVRVQSYTQASRRSGDYGFLTSQHTCVRSLTRTSLHEHTLQARARTHSNTPQAPLAEPRPCGVLASLQHANVCNHTSKHCKQNHDHELLAIDTCAQSVTHKHRKPTCHHGLP